MDNCKNCGCTRFECKHCIAQEYYRHVDDKIKMKRNCKTIRIIGWDGYMLFDKNEKTQYSLTEIIKLRLI